MPEYTQTSLFDIVPDATADFTPPSSTTLLTAPEIYDLADAELLQTIKEDRRIERKVVGVQEKLIGDYLCMWSNTAPYGGLIAVGVADNGTLSGCAQKDIKHINSLESAGMIFCPDAIYESKHVTFTKANGEKDFILLFRVRYIENKVVRNNKHEVFRRVGDKKRELSAEEVRELEIDKGQVSFEKEAVDLKFPEDFDLKLIREFTDNYVKTRGVDRPYSDEEILELRYLGTRQNGKFSPNNACAIAFAKDPCSIFPGCRIRFLRFEGEEEGTGERLNLSKDQWFDQGGIVAQIKSAEKFIASQLREYTRLRADGKFYSSPEYPHFAWLEALVNACVHRSYALRHMNIFVKMFDDRLEIESPGNFPPFVTSENIYSMHHPRNPNLFDALFYLGFTKGMHEGTRRMRESMQAMELPLPEFHQQKDNNPTVVVRLRNAYKQRKVWVDSDAISIVGESIFKTLSQEERRAINFASENNGVISVSDLQRITQGTWPAASKILQKLERRGILHHKRRSGLDRDPQARYHLSDKE
jgi:ATP-dependent DNA helicase RecG